MLTPAVHVAGAGGNSMRLVNGTEATSPDSPPQVRLYPYAVGIFASLLLVSNIAATQPVEFRLSSDFGLILDGGFLLFPLAYIVGDLLSEVYGFRLARRAVYLSFAVTVGALAYFQLVIALPTTEGWDASPFESLLGFAAPRIVLGSLLGFLAGQLLNAWSLVAIKKRTGERHLWARLMGSTVVGESADTIIFCLFAAPVIGLSDAGSILNYVLVGLAWKTLVEAVLLPVTYAVVRWAKRKEAA